MYDLVRKCGSPRNCRHARSGAMVPPADRVMPATRTSLTALVATMALLAVALIASGTARAETAAPDDGVQVEDARTDAPRVVIVSTSHEQAEGERRTGLWLSELTEPYWVFRDVGYEVELASIRGGTPPVDHRSADPEEIPEAFRHDETALAAFRDTHAIADLDPADFDAVFLAGGHGTMWDFTDNPDLGRFVAALHDVGLPVAAVCHGQAGLVGVRDAGGEFIVAGREVTSFTNTEELLFGWRWAIPYSLQDRLEEEGAQFTSTFIPFRGHAVRDGNLITGQNPSSAEETALLVVDALSERPRPVASMQEASITHMPTGARSISVSELAEYRVDAALPATVEQ